MLRLRSNLTKEASLADFNTIYLYFEVSSYFVFALIYCYKIIFGLIGIDCPNFFEIGTTSVTKGHSHNIIIQASLFMHSTVRSSFFWESVVELDVRNGLSPDSV